MSGRANTAVAVAVVVLRSPGLAAQGAWGGLALC
jgi:hypothetical protein